MAERWYARLSRIFQHRLSTRQPLVLYASHADFEQTNVIEGTLGEGTGGVTEMLKRRIVLPLAATMAESDHVIGHELVHAFQYDVANRIGRGPNGGSRGIEQLPLWFIEGMAEYLSLGPIDPHTAMRIRDAAREEKLPTIRQLANAKYFPYRWGQGVLGLCRRPLWRSNHRRAPRRGRAQGRHGRSAAGRTEGRSERSVS
jgi:hypothetical protein